MRTEPQSNGRSHNANYGDFHESQILFANIDCSYPISVEPKAAATPVVAVFGLVSFAALGAGLRCVPLILQLNFHALLLGFVGEHLPSLTMQHLMNFLIRFFAIINRRTKSADIANYNGLHSSIVESGNKFCRLFMLNIPNLVIQLCQLPFL